MSLVFFVRWSTQLGQQAVLWWRHVTLAKCRECQAQPPTLPTNLCLSMEWNRARKPIKLEKGRLSHDLWWYILIFNRIHEKSRTSVLLVIYVYGNTVDGSKMQQFYWFHIIYIYVYTKGIHFAKWETQRSSSSKPQDNTDLQPMKLQELMRHSGRKRWRFCRPWTYCFVGIQTLR